MSILPAIQSFIDSVEGSCGYTGAIAPDAGQIIGYSAGFTYFSRFDFANGTLLNRQLISGLGISVNPFGGAVVYDPAVAHLWVDKDDDDNAVGLAQLDPTTTPWTVDTTWGTGGSGFSPPNNVPYFASQQSLTVSTSTPSHWLVQGSLLGGYVSVVRIDRPGGVGFWGHYLQITSTDSPSVCAGPQSSASATAYWTSHPFSSMATCKFGKTVISAGAETYNPASWPTPNPNIASTVLKSYLPTDFDAAWSTFNSFSGPAYDQSDGNVIVTVSTTDAVTHKQYVAKLRASDGAVLWATPVDASNGFQDQSITFSRIKNGKFYYLAASGIYGANLHAITTSSGADTITALTGVNVSGQISDDVLGCIVGAATWDTSHGVLTLLNSTPSSGSSLAALYVVPGSTGSSSAVGDTQFFGT